MSDVGFPDSLPAAGSKRSIRDRLGSNSDSSQVNHKRCVHRSSFISMYSPSDSSFWVFYLLMHCSKYSSF